MLKFFEISRFKILFCGLEFRTFDPIFNRLRFNKVHDHKRLGKTHSKVSFSLKR